MSLTEAIETVRKAARLDERIEAFRQKYGFPREN